ncbi:hypothetical protein ACFY3V_26015 [Streptosporangium sp. NPDC000095]|uniref:hypothetical protein n=1 Tax=Streptosporangium sp. NPDC000095 TaxID=3366184 RepID=UPI0036ACB758
MSTTKVKIALGVVSAASLCAMLGAVAPASADTPPGVTFWSGAFTGQSVNYPNPSSDCTTLPFTVHSEFNNSDKSILIYNTTNCTGQALTFPANDIHSFIRFDGQSFRTVG